MIEWSVSTKKFLKVLIVKRVFTQMSATLSKQIGNPDLIVLFTNTVSHKMARCAVEEAERCNADVVRCHSSSKNALQEILGSICM